MKSEVVTFLLYSIVLLKAKVALFYLTAASLPRLVT